jgi:hypothetical protein
LGSVKPSLIHGWTAAHQPKVVERVPAKIKVANGAQRPGTVIRRTATAATTSISSEDEHHRRCPLYKGGNDNDGGDAGDGHEGNLTTAA